MAISSKQRYQTVKVATLFSAASNILLAIFKVIIGYFGHSQALIADGIHSFSDLITDGLVLIAGRMGAQSPDEEHPYGHRRIETIGTIILALIIMGVGVGIAYEAVHHLVEHVHLKPHYPVIIVAVISVILNEALYYYSIAQSKKVQSDLLRANAWHHRSDSWISAVVLLSAIGAMFGVYILDAIGAFLIAILIAQMGVKMIWKNASELIDSGVDEKTLKKIREIILEVPGVIAIHQLRSRSHSGYIFVDVHIQVDSSLSISEGHYISEQVVSRLIKSLNYMQDVTVHIDSEDDERAMLSLNLPNRSTIESLLRTHWQSLPGYADIQHKVFHYLNGQLTIDIYLSLALLKNETAENLASQYQNAVKSIPEIKKINIYYH